MVFLYKNPDQFFNPHHSSQFTAVVYCSLLPTTIPTTPPNMIFNVAFTLIAILFSVDCLSIEGLKSVSFLPGHVSLLDHRHPYDIAASTSEQTELPSPWISSWSSWVAPSINKPSKPIASSSQESYHRVRRAKTPTSIKLSKLSNLVKMMKLEDCAGRVVCDLSCQPDYFGSDGKRVLKTLVNIQSSGKMDKEEMRFYLNAGVAGRKAKTGGDCSTCIDTYPCAASSGDLVDVVSLIRIDV